MITSTGNGETGKGEHGKADLDDERRQPKSPNPFEHVAEHLRELREYVAHYFSVRGDAAKAKVRSAAYQAIFYAIVGIVALTALVTCAVMTFVGLADGLGVLLNGHFWVGKLIVGLTMIIGTVVAVKILTSRKVQSARQRTIQKYERLRDHERFTVGVTASERAADRRRTAETGHPPFDR
jgi:hypothetical protein